MASKKTEKQNIAFMELYKTVDGSIKALLGSSEGVSEYIRRLEKTAGSRRSTDEAKQDLKMLKHLRWARNMLAHEVDYGTEVLKPGDFEWLQSFRKKLKKKKLTVKPTLADRIKSLFSRKKS